MPRFNYGNLSHIQERWRNDPNIPNWKRDGMVALTDKLKRKIADNHGEPSGVELYYPEECSSYDVFMTVAFALDALVVPRSIGYTMRCFGDYRDDIE